MRDFPLFSGISRFFPFFFFFFFRGFESSSDSLDGNVINGRSFVFVIFLIIIGTFSSFLLLFHHSIKGYYIFGFRNHLKFEEFPLYRGSRSNTKNYLKHREFHQT